MMQYRRSSVRTAFLFKGGSGGGAAQEEQHWDGDGDAGGAEKTEATGGAHYLNDLPALNFYKHNVLIIVTKSVLVLLQ